MTPVVGPFVTFSAGLGVTERRVSINLQHVTAITWHPAGDMPPAVSIETHGRSGAIYRFSGQDNLDRLEQTILNVQAAWNPLSRADHPASVEPFYPYEWPWP